MIVSGCPCRCPHGVAADAHRRTDACYKRSLRAAIVWDAALTSLGATVLDVSCRP